MHNENDDPRSFAVSVEGRQFEYTLPGGALATFTWPRGAVPRDRLAPVALRGAVATADPPASNRATPSTGTPRPAGPAGRPSSPASTCGWTSTDRCSSGGSRSTAAGTSARGWELAVSLDGTTWRTVAVGTGTGQLTTVDLPRTRARHFRVTATAAAGNWWSVADFRLYA